MYPAHIYTTQYKETKLHQSSRQKFGASIRSKFGFIPIRDRPFNLKGGCYGFLFRSEICFRTTQELEYLFFLSHKAQFFFQNSTLGYMTKILNQISFFSSAKIRIFFLFSRYVIPRCFNFGLFLFLVILRCTPSFPCYFSSPYG